MAAAVAVVLLTSQRLKINLLQVVKNIFDSPIDLSDRTVSAVSNRSLYNATRTDGRYVGVGEQVKRTFIQLDSIVVKLKSSSDQTFRMQ